MIDAFLPPTIFTAIKYICVFTMRCCGAAETTMIKSSAFECHLLEFVFSPEFYVACRRHSMLLQPNITHLCFSLARTHHCECCSASSIFLCLLPDNFKDDMMACIEGRSQLSWFWSTLGIWRHTKKEKERWRGWSVINGSTNANTHQMRLFGLISIIYEIETPDDGQHFFFDADNQTDSK